MTQAVQDLRSALDDVPSLLLDEHLSGVLDEAVAATDALEVFTAEPSVVVVVGPAGSGKSTIVNALVGSDVALVSPVRPTTTALTAIGDPAASAVAGVSEFVVTDGLAGGLVVVDTPSFDAAASAIEPVVASASLAIVVVTPSRYGDEQVARAIASAERANTWILVANRLPQRDSERAQILDAIHERLGVAPLITIIEGAAVNLDGVLDDVPRDTTADTRRLDLRSRAALASRRIAGELTREAIHLGELEVALANADTPTAASMSLDNAMEWEEARSAVIAVATDMVTAWDTSIEASVDHALAARVREVLQEPDVDQLRAQVDAWREDTSHRFRRRAKIWFRKRTGDALLDHWSWLAATNPDEPLPRRVRRMMGDALESTVRKSRADLVAIADGPVVQRLGAWQDVVNQAGGYRPGVLKAAADALDPGGPVDG